MKMSEFWTNRKLWAEIFKTNMSAILVCVSTEGISVLKRFCNKIFLAKSAKKLVKDLENVYKNNGYYSSDNNILNIEKCVEKTNFKNFCLVLFSRLYGFSNDTTNYDEYIYRPKLTEQTKKALEHIVPPPAMWVETKKFSKIFSNLISQAAARILFKQGKNNRKAKDWWSNGRSWAS